MSKRENRSTKYQYLILECPWDYNALCSFPDNSNKDYDKLGCLRDKLLEEVKRIMAKCLTDNQRRVLEMYYFDDMTQDEIADKLGKNQSSVVKSIIGNHIRSKISNKNISYGGSIKKLKRFCMQDPIILQILSDIEELDI